MHKLLAILRVLARAISRRARSARDAIAAIVGPDELAVYAALGMLAVGCWQIWPPAAFLVPGTVMLWMYLPTRASFIERRPDKGKKD